MKYYYNDGYHSHGPFTLDQLKSKEIYSHTLINVVGTKHWVKAHEVETISSIVKKPVSKRKRKVKERLDHNKVKEQLDKLYELKSDPVSFDIVDLDSRKKIKNYLFSSIVSIFSFLVLGILAVISSAKVDALNRSNNVEEARKQSRLARMLAYSGIFFTLGLSLWVLLVGQIVYSIIEIS